MAHIWLRCVQRSRSMSYILCGVEDPECQTGQEVTRGQKPSHWSDCEPGAAFEELRDVLQLGDVV